MYRFVTNKGNYENWSIDNCNINININPLESKLFNNDTFNISNRDVVIENSQVRNSIMPGVLVLEKNKKYGMVNSKYLYKCIPNDISIPMFLIPYNPRIEFNKKMYNKYILFSYKHWNNKHPYGSIVEIFGDVNDVTNFYNYQLYCKNVYTSIKSFNKILMKKVKLKKIETHFDIICKKYNITDFTNVNNIFTIDPNDCTDFDDAVSIKETKHGYLLSIYISNVALWLDYFDVWECITNQVSTIYLPNSKRSMLPKILSDNICSLLENKNRIALTLDISIDKDFNIIDNVFSNKMIRVNYNFRYDTRSLKKSKKYKMLNHVVKELNRKYTYLDGIKDSHDVISYLMIYMNYTSALKLKKNKCGLFRCMKINNEMDTVNNVEISNFLKIWNSDGSNYSLYNNMSSHDMLKLDSYIHITSPIRRLCDVLNLICLQKVMGNEIVSESCKKFFEQWVKKENIEYINKNMKSIRRVQSDCALLSTCSKVNKSKYNGFVFEKEKKKKTDKYKYKYMVYIPELKLVNKYITQNDVKLFKMYDFKIYLFMDAIRLKQKIKLDMV
tara:strand:- start:2289 stop:3956 length:1668 start_codon:yes stop_codon:yes gene_type:complete